MKFCVYGLGAVGGLIAGRLALSGASVSAIARGATLDVVRREGLTLIQNGASRTVPLHVSDTPEDLGVQDIVILTVKNSGLLDAAERMAPLLGAQTTILSAMNGVPWWFQRGLKESLPALRLSKVDPAGKISKAISSERVIGCVCNLSASTPRPGSVCFNADARLTIGEPGGGSTARCTAVIEALRRAGFEVFASDLIQQTIWFKLWGNMTVNPISAITGATADLIVGDELVRAYMSRCMLEAAEIGGELGLTIGFDPETRHAVTSRLGTFRTSMLQDVEAGKRVELDSLVGVVVEIARQVGIETPNIDALFGLARLHAQALGLYP